jgi:beta-phosphoglucomutase-like phosphatase (HAD superfamily)
VNHPALIKTSDQPSFSYASFPPFTPAEALSSSDISPVPSLNLQPNPHGGTAKKITRTKNLLRQLKKKNKIKQATKSKTSRLASSALLGL